VILEVGMVMAELEADARKLIDEQLTQAGWVIQDRDELNLKARLGVAVREFPLKTGEADYLLFVGGKAVGAVEAKKADTTLSGVAAQLDKYSTGLPTNLTPWHRPLPFLYATTGRLCSFMNGLDPRPDYRDLFSFHRPETLRQWMNDWQAGAGTLRSRLQTMPPVVTTGLWSAQVQAITGLEQSLAAGKPRALISMATGSGKTFTAINAVYRLLKDAKAQRVLFMVDRANLGDQAYKEFSNFQPSDSNLTFTKLYTTKHLNSNNLDPANQVFITTIQRLYSILSGEPELDPADEQQSLFAQDEQALVQPIREVRYNPALPIEFFDFIVIDESHRSIYTVWRQVLDYFDAFHIGLTATPSAHTLAFFKQNTVMNYTRAQAVADGVNVDEQVYCIRTRISGQGSRVDKVEADYYIDKRDRHTRVERQELMDDDLRYEASQLDRQVVAEDQIRTIIRTFKERLFVDLFPERSGNVVPKTLIFAKDDSHAEDIVRIVREEFNQGGNFCRKITYKVSGIDPQDLINQFRTDPDFRIAVTVDMIATGTDVKPIEILLLMRVVQSKQLFEQMQGRGTRVMRASDLRRVTSDAEEKNRFIFIDTVGIFERAKIEPKILDRQRSVGFEKLLEQLAMGDRADEVLSSLAARLARLNKKLTPTEHEQVHNISGGKTLTAISRALVDALDPEQQWQRACELGGSSTPSDEQLAAARAEMVEAAADLLAANPSLRKLLNQIHKRSEQVIDRLSRDDVVELGYTATSIEQALAKVESFEQFIAARRDQIVALQILYGQPYSQQRLTLAAVKELKALLEQPPLNLSLAALWGAYRVLDGDKVRPVSSQRAATDVVALVRHALQREGKLVPYGEVVADRYQRWLAQQRDDGRNFSLEQQQWLDLIAAHIAESLTTEPDDLDTGRFFDIGGQVKARQLFGLDLTPLLNELSLELVV